MSDKGRLQNDVANKQSMVEELRKSDDSNLQKEADRQETEIKGIQQEIKNPNK